MNRRKACRYAFAHTAIILSGMLMVLLAIDRVNESMIFIDNSITKIILWLLCAVSILNAARLLARPKKKTPQKKP